MAEDFEHAKMAGTRFHDVDLSGAEFRAVRLAGAVFHGVDLTGARIRGADPIDVEVTGEVRNLTVNGVDVVPLVEAELDRRDPDRVKMRPTTLEGYREAWDLLEQRWSETVDRARKLPPDKLHEQVGGEWSFIETLRHLVFATDAWHRRGILGDPSPWHPLDLPWDEMEDTPGVPRDREVRPSLDEVLALRNDRRATVRKTLDELTPERLDSQTEPVEGPGWPPPVSLEVSQCLSVILNEEYMHRQYAERDLSALE